jgi:AraC-like DNA-binding protein
MSLKTAVVVFQHAITSLTLQSKTFTDFDAFADSVCDMHVEMMFQNAKHRSWTINQVYLSDIHVQLARLGSGNVVEGQASSNVYLIYLPVSASYEYLANGTAIQKGAFLILEPGCEFCVATKSEHDWCSIFIPAHRFADAGEENSSETEKSRCRVSRAGHRAASRFALLVDHTMTTDAQRPEFENSPAAMQVEADLLNLALAVVGQPAADQHCEVGRPLIPRNDIVHRCKRSLQGLDARPIRVDELAAAAGVSQWTLRRAFKEWYGISPLRYLRLRELHQVHRKLKASDPEETTITDVLSGHGVSEFGRFASPYGALFGELPSETLGAKKQ